MAKNKPTVSFEFFPPKTDKAETEFWTHVKKLATVGPAFMTMTYGAGGSTRDKTLEMATGMRRKTGVPIASHLTALGTDKKDVERLADAFWQGEVRHIVALRGDRPKDPNVMAEMEQADYYHYAKDLVTALKERHDFEISVGAYPEKHPEAPDLDTDIQYLKQKCETGVTRAITQFFFDNDHYYRFIEKTDAAGITTPIVPGILPIGNFEKMLSFAKSCETSVPKTLIERFDKTGTNETDRQKLAEDILVTQCEDLIAHDVSHIHFYTLNKSEMVIRACEACGLAV